MTKSIEDRTLAIEVKHITENVNGLYFKKIQKNTDNSLNSGNLCSGLLAELCLVGS